MAHILYVDDEEALVFMTTRMLELSGFKVAGYTLPADALAAFQSEPEKFDLVLTDHAMPGMSGLELARQILAIRPNAAVAIATLYIEPRDANAARRIGVLDIVGKPGKIEEAAQTVNGLLDKARGAKRDGT